MRPRSLDEPIGLRVAGAAKTLGRAFDEALETAGGSTPIWLVLLSLKSGQASAQRAIAESIGIEGPTLTHHLNRMEAGGLITRARRPENRRVHEVKLTELGEERFLELRDVVVEFDRRLRRGLDPDDEAKLRSILERLEANAARPTP